MRRPSIFLGIRCQDGIKITIGPSDVYQSHARKLWHGWNFFKRQDTFVLLHRHYGCDFFVNILKTQLILSAKELYGNRWELQQDNDPKHTSHVATEFYKENKIRVMDWPSNSPDLNPIKNVWQIVKKKRMPQDIGELRQYMVEEWETFQTKQ